MPFTVQTGMIKEQTGTNVSAFVAYVLNKHWAGRVTCQNILDEAYPLGMASAFANDASFPRTFGMELDYKF
jgi:outer membrane receptor protein involved in Fe transport